MFIAFSLRLDKESEKSAHIVSLTILIVELKIIIGIYVNAIFKQLESVIQFWTGTEKNIHRFNLFPTSNLSFYIVYKKFNSQKNNSSYYPFIKIRFWNKHMSWIW